MQGTHTLFGSKRVVVILAAILIASLTVYNVAFDKTAELNQEDILKQVAQDPEFIKYFGEGLQTLTTLDTDRNGVPDVLDNDIDGDGIPNDQDDDIDGDGIPNEADPTTALVSLLKDAGLTKPIQGDKGDKGDKGDQGDAGVSGGDGNRGDDGLAGNEGDDGGDGTDGSQGNQGDLGGQGNNGNDGQVGLIGPQGPQGATGLTGATGAKGDKGDKGDQGDAGTVGVVTDDGVIQTTLTGADLDIQLVLAAGSGLEKLGSGLSLTTACSNDELLKWNGSAWTCATDDGGITYSAGTGISIAAGVISSILGTDIDSSEIVDGTITASDIGTGAVGSDEIINASIVFADWASNSCNSGEVAKFNGTVWACAADVDTDTTLSEANVEAFIFDGDNVGTLSSGTLALDSLSYTGTLDDVNINDALTISSAGSVADGALSANVSLLGASIESTEITNGTILFADIASNGCNSGEIMRFNGSAWTCGTDADTTYTAGSGISFVGTVISSNLGDSIETSEITDGTILLNDFAQNGCNNNQVIKWNGSAWACASDVDTDTDTTYTAGTGLSLTGTTFAIDSNVVTSNYSGSVTATSFTGSGAGLTNLDGAEIDNNSIDGSKIALSGQGVGSLMYYDGTDWVSLGIGGANQVLGVNAGGNGLEWKNASSGGGFSSLDIANDTDGGDIGTAAATVDQYTNFNINQTTASQTFTIPDPTDDAGTRGKIVTINNVGSANFTIGGITVPAGSYGSAFVWTGTSWNPINAASNVAAEYGENTGITNNQQTSSTSFVDVAGSSFTLPSAGTWRIIASVTTYNSSTGANYFRLTDTAGTVVSNSEAYWSANSQINSSQQVTINTEITTTGAATYKMQWRVSAGTATLVNSTTNASSKITFEKISGNAPVIGQSVDYVNVYASSDLVNVASQAPLVFNTVLSGNIPYNTTNGRFTLSAGKTYSLSSNVAVRTSDATGVVAWYNVTGSSYISPSGSTIAANNVTSINGDNQATVIFTPLIDTIVELRHNFAQSRTYAGGPISTNATSASQATIIQLGSTASTGVAMSSLAAAITANALDNTSFGQTWNWSTLSTGDGLVIESGSASASGSLLKFGLTNASASGTALNITNAGTGLAFRVNDDGTYNDSTPFVIDADGLVGIRSLTTAGATLTLGDMGGAEGGELRFKGAGSSDFQIDAFNDGGAQDFRVMENGTVRAYLQIGVNGWQTPSDARLKDNIMTLDNVLERLEGVRGTSYNLKDSGALQVGVIAQEFQAAFPGVVSGDVETGLLGVSYDSVAAIAIQGIKELDAQHDAFAAQIGAQIEAVTNLGAISGTSVVTGLSLDFGSNVTLAGALNSLADKVGELDGRVAALEAVDPTVTNVTNTTEEVTQNITQIIESTQQYGVARVLASKGGVKITFAKPYKAIPAVFVTPLNGVDYEVRDVTVSGFVIMLPAAAETDKYFNWMAAELDPNAIENGVQIEAPVIPATTENSNSGSTTDEI